MSRDPRLFLADIEESCRRILMYTRGLDRRRFGHDTRTVDAVLRNLEVIGEAVKRLPPELVRDETSIEWRRIAGLRDMAAHAYFGIDLDIVWDVVQHKIEPLKDRVAEMIGGDGRERRR